jgi:hypothetical protein
MGLVSRGANVASHYYISVYPTAIVSTASFMNRRNVETFVNWKWPILRINHEVLKKCARLWFFSYVLTN